MKYAYFYMYFHCVLLLVTGSAATKFTCTQGQCTLDGTVTTGYAQCSNTILYGTGSPTGSYTACYVRVLYRLLSHEID